VHVYVFYHLILLFTLYYSVYDFTSLCKHVRLLCVFIINLLTYLLSRRSANKCFAKLLVFVKLVHIPGVGGTDNGKGLKMRTWRWFSSTFGAIQKANVVANSSKSTDGQFKINVAYNEWRSMDDFNYSLTYFNSVRCDAIHECITLANDQNYNRKLATTKN